MPKLNSSKLDHFVKEKGPVFDLVLAAIFFLPFEIRTNRSGPTIFVRFSNGQNKMAAKKIFG